MVASEIATKVSSRPNAARIAAYSCALAIHVAVFGVLLVPITRPLMPELVRAVEDPVWIEQVRQEILPIPPVRLPRAIAPVKPAPVRPRPVEATQAPVFEHAAIPEPAGVPIPTRPIDDQGSPEAASPAGAGRLAIVHGPPPRYPAPAIRRHLEGVVVLRILVGEDGRPIEVEVESSSGHAQLDAAARRQVLKHWLFAAAKRDGRPVQAWGTVPVHFILKQL